MWANDKKKEEEEKEEQREEQQERDVLGGKSIDEMIANGEAIKITDAKDAVNVLKNLAEAMDNNDPEAAKRLIDSLSGGGISKEDLAKANETAKKIHDEAFKIGESDMDPRDMLAMALAYSSAAVMKAHCDGCAEELLYKLANTIIDLPVKRVRSEAREKGIHPVKEEKDESESKPD